MNLFGGGGFLFTFFTSVHILLLKVVFDKTAFVKFKISYNF